MEGGGWGCGGARMGRMPAHRTSDRVRGWDACECGSCRTQAGVQPGNEDATDGGGVHGKPPALRSPSSPLQGPIAAHLDGPLVHFIVLAVVVDVGVVACVNVLAGLGVVGHLGRRRGGWEQGEEGEGGAGGGRQGVARSTRSEWAQQKAMHVPCMAALLACAAPCRLLVTHAAGDRGMSDGGKHTTRSCTTPLQAVRHANPKLAQPSGPSARLPHTLMALVVTTLRRPTGAAARGVVRSTLAAAWRAGTTGVPAETGGSRGRRPVVTCNDLQVDWKATRSPQGGSAEAWEMPKLGNWRSPDLRGLRNHRRSRRRSAECTS